jgi:hypothetical protein
MVWGSRQAVVLQGPGEAELMTVRVGQMKKVFTLCGITRHGVRPIAAGDDMRVQSVDIRYIEDGAPPPCPISLFGLDDKVQVAGSGAKTAE